MDKQIKIKDYENYRRDLETNAVVNTNIHQYKIYIDQYKRKINEVRSIQNLQNEVSSLKNDLDEIKSLLRSITNGSK